MFFGHISSFILKGVLLCLVWLYTSCRCSFPSSFWSPWFSSPVSYSPSLQSVFKPVVPSFFARLLSLFVSLPSSFVISCLSLDLFNPGFDPRLPHYSSKSFELFQSLLCAAGPSISACVWPVYCERRFRKKLKLCRLAKLLNLNGQFKWDQNITCLVINYHLPKLEDTKRSGCLLGPAHKGGG